VKGRSGDHTALADSPVDSDRAALVEAIAAMEHEVVKLDARIARLSDLVRPGWSPLYWFSAARAMRKRELEECLGYRRIYCDNIRTLVARVQAMPLPPTA